MTEAYAIGDVHGQLELLRAAHDLVEQDRAAHAAPDAPLIHVGDLVDRGPNAAGVLEFLTTRHASDPRLITLLGNHDRMFLWFVREGHEDPRLFSDLSYRNPRIGGDKTFLSYGVDPTGSMEEVRAEAIAAVPAHHLDFIATRPLTHQTSQAFFCHAGVRPGVPLAAQDTEDLLWIREGFMEDTTDHGALIVHGHTPVGVDEMHHSNHLDIDTGAAFGGPLTVVAMEGRSVWRLTETGRVPVPDPRAA
ncbi:MAG: metallophosphoesterase [Pseudomonadota bacterium]